MEVDPYESYMVFIFGAFPLDRADLLQHGFPRHFQNLIIHHITCQLEARKALIYQLVLGLTGENGKNNYSKAVHLYPPLFDIFFSAKNYKTTPALTGLPTEDICIALAQAQIPPALTAYSGLLNRPRLEI